MSHSALVDMIIMAAGETRLAAYIEQTYPAEAIAPGNYTLDNAADWLDIEAFTRWLNQGASDANTRSIDASRQSNDAHSTRRRSGTRSSQDE